MHRTLSASLAALLAGAPVHAQEAEASALTPAARQHNTRGMRAFLARDLDRAVVELQLAYAAMPDPVAHRSGRDLVLSSLRSVHLERYKTSRSRADLCAARELQRAHVHALRTALGASARPDDTAGPQRSLDELDAKVAHDFPDTPRCDAPPTVSTPPRPQPLIAPPPPAPLHPSTDTTRIRRHRGAAAALFGLGGLTAVGSIAAAAVYGARFNRLDELERRVRTPAELAEIDELHAQGRTAKMAAIALGASTGLLLFIGAAVLATTPRRPSRVSVTPSLAPTLWTLQLRATF